MNGEYTAAITTIDHAVRVNHPEGEAEERCFDIVTIYRNGQEVGEVYVESSGDIEPYDAALQRAGWRGWVWTTVTNGI